MPTYIDLYDTSKHESVTICHHLLNIWIIMLGIIMFLEPYDDN